MHRRLLSCLILPLVTVAALPSAEPPITTGFEVRREAAELLDDLRRAGPQDDVDGVLNRLRLALERSGEELVAVPASAAATVPEARPFQAVAAAIIVERGLGERWRALAPIPAPASANSPSAMPDRAAQDPMVLRRIAATWAGTTAGTAAAGELARRAWDRGELGLALAWADAGGAGSVSAASGADQRRDAALRLLQPPIPVLPGALEGLQEVWRTTLDGRAAAVATAGGEQKPKRLRAAIGPVRDAVAPVADGTRLVLVDALVGQASPAIALGSQPLTSEAARPAVIPGGFAACGIVDNTKPTVTAVDPQGRLRWRAAMPAAGWGVRIGAPCAIDRLVCVPVISDLAGPAELRIHAFDQATGALRWSVAVARLGGDAGMLNQNASGSPMLVVAGGRLVVLSNAGVLARLRSDGQVDGLWQYHQPTPGANRWLERDQPQRRGLLQSDGTTAVATPSDGPPVAWLLGGTGGPRRYAGDGAGGDVIAAQGGTALLAGARITALDLATTTVRWQLPSPGNGPAQAIAGSRTALIASDEALALVELASGRELGRRPLPQPIALGGDGGVVLLAGASDHPWIAAYGSGSVADDLRAQAAADPADHRPLVALGTLLAARGDDLAALDAWDQALARGADPDTARRAATVLRRRLDRATAETWDPLLKRLTELARRAGDVESELAYWRARRREAAGDAVGAAAGYQAVIAGSGQTIAFDGGFDVHLHTLAEAGLQRLAPAMASPRAVPAPIAAITRAWAVTGKRAPGQVVADGLADPLVIDFTDGVLVARRLSDGGEVWWRKPDVPRLGVQSRRDEVGGQVPVDVLPGSAAAAAGIESGDVLVRFNGMPVHSFTADLVPAVVRLPIRGAFTVQVARGGRVIDLAGHLGGEPVAAIAADARTVLVWPTMPVSKPGEPPTSAPEGLWVEVHDLLTGRERWRHGVPPSTRAALPAKPVLLPGDLVLLSDGEDLIALPALADNPGVLAPAWRIPGEGRLLAEAQVLGGGAVPLLWLPESLAGTATLRRVGDGRLVARMPVRIADPPLLHGNQLVASDSDGGLASWDLGYGQRRWQNPGLTRAIALGEDLLAVTREGTLATVDGSSGKIRRTHPWTGVGASATAGDTIYLHVQPAADRHAIACLSTQGGSARWSEPLPGAPTAITADASGCTVVFATGRTRGGPGGDPGGGPGGGDADAAHPGDRSGTGAVRFAAAGALRSVIASEGTRPGDAVAIAEGLLVGQSVGLEFRPGGIHPQPAPVETGPGAGGAGAQLTWNPLGAARWAVQTIDAQLVLHLAFPAGDDRPMIVRLATPGPRLEVGSTRLAIPARGSVQVDAEDPAEAWRVVMVADDPTRLGYRTVQLAPPLGRHPGLPLVLRIDHGAASNAPGPWWLRSSWQPIAGAP